MFLWYVFLLIYTNFFWVYGECVADGCVVKMNYEQSVLFKERFFRHVWEVDVDSLRRLLDSYPDGPLCERFHVSLSGVFEKNFFLKYDGERAVDILFSVLCGMVDSGHRRSWRPFFLPSGVRLSDPVRVQEMLLLLLRRGAVRAGSVGYTLLCEPPIRVSTLVGNALAYFCGRDPLDVVGLAAFLDALPSEWVPEWEHYCVVMQLGVVAFPSFLRRFGLPARGDDLMRLFFESLSLPVQSDVDVWDSFLSFGAISPVVFSGVSEETMKRLWKLRLVRVDARWSRVEDVPVDVDTVEAFKDMFDGHPSNVEVFKKRKR